MQNRIDDSKRNALLNERKRLHRVYLIIKLIKKTQRKSNTSHSVVEMTFPESEAWFKHELIINFVESQSFLLNTKKESPINLMGSTPGPIAF